MRWWSTLAWCKAVDRILLPVSNCLFCWCSGNDLTWRFPPKWMFLCSRTRRLDSPIIAACLCWAITNKLSSLSSLIYSHIGRLLSIKKWPPSSLILQGLFYDRIKLFKLKLGESNFPGERLFSILQVHASEFTPPRLLSHANHNQRLKNVPFYSWETLPVFLFFLSISSTLASKW